jgi:hypothetical protein
LTWECGEPCENVADMTETQIFRNPPKGTRGFFSYNKALNEIVILFRGSVKMENAYSDFDFITMNYPAAEGAQIHSGFYLAQ